MLVAVVLVAVLLLGNSGGNYRVHALFQNASQLVNGDLVEVSGRPVGKVTNIDLTPDGQANLTLHIDDDFAPLRQGTQLVVRQQSLSGVANRYVDLMLPGGSPPAIDDGATISADHTTTAVDLDEIFNVFGSKERKALSNLIRGFAQSYGGRGAEANRAWAYLNPSIASSTALFAELNRDTPLFKRFIVANSKLVTDVAARKTQVAGLVSHLSQTLGATAAKRGDLGDAIQRLPDFMRRANSTFVDLRSTLDDLDPLVAESKPVVHKLRPFLAALRPFAHDARPTVADLSKVVRSPGAGNDLVELTRGTIPVRDIAVGTAKRNGKQREGALPASAKALGTATPELGFARPYAVDLTGWFDDFGHSGIYDALGGASRAAPHVNAFAAVEGGLPGCVLPAGQTCLLPVPPALRGALFDSVATLHQDNRCPGSAEHKQPDGSVPYKPSADFNCDPSQVLPGP